MTLIFRKRIVLISLGLSLLLTAVGCGETQNLQISPTATEQSAENEVSESPEESIPDEPQLTPEEYLKMLESDDEYIREYLDYTIDSSSFSIIETTLHSDPSLYPKPLSIVTFQCSVFNDDKSLERVLKSDVWFDYEDNNWVPSSFYLRRSNFIVHHGLELSEEELKPIIETCLGYEIENVPEYTVTTGSLENTSDPYDEFCTEYCFYLINDQYTYGGIVHTLTLKFYAFESGSWGNDRIYESGENCWTLYDVGVKLSDPDAELNYDWMKASLKLGKENSLNFEFNLDSWGSNVSLPDGYYHYGYNGNYEKHEQKSMHGIEMITPGIAYGYNPEKAETEIGEFLMNVDAAWMDMNRADAYTALLIGEPYDILLKDAETGAIIPQSSIAVGFTDVDFTVRGKDKNIKIPAVFLITYDGIYCAVPNAGIGGFEDDNSAKTTTIHLMKMEVLEHGYND